MPRPPRIALVALAALALTAGAADAGGYGRYGYSQSRGYSYRTYSYYVPAYRVYRAHVAVYVPSRPRYVYYYNSHSRVFWGRYDTQAGNYQLLPDAAKRADLAQIREADFLPGGPMPKEGEGSDEQLLPPPPAPPVAPPVAPAPPQSPAPLPTGTCH